MIPHDVIDKLKGIVINNYAKAYGAIGKEIKYEDFVGYFDDYPIFNMIGDYKSFIIYDTIGQEDKVCKIIDVISDKGKAYFLWGKLAKEYDTIYTYAYDKLPVVKRTYKKLGLVGTGDYNNAGQQLYVRIKSRRG